MHPTKSCWDKTVFRISRIHNEVGIQSLSHTLMRLFEIEDSDFKIYSLASDATDEVEPKWKSATISFRERPTLLQPSQSTSDEWIFPLPSVPIDLSMNGDLYFDTHFDGFTPLSPAEKDAEHTIEYDFSTSQ